MYQPRGVLKPVLSDSTSAVKMPASMVQRTSSDLAITLFITNIQIYLR